MLIGLLADTHVPYRAPAIPTQIVEAFRGVDAILHAGDVDAPAALLGLRALAPVYAVRGNAHLFDRSSGGATLPEAVELNFAGFHVALTHGHQLGMLGWYWRLRMAGLSLLGHWEDTGYDEAIVRALLHRFPRADVIVFGHTHRFFQAQRGATLLINPGAAMRTAYFHCPFAPSIAYLELVPGQMPKVTQVMTGD